MTHRIKRYCLGLIIGGVLTSQGVADEQTYRLYHGITLYAHNDKPTPFTVALELQDINMFADGPREALFKIYDPDGRVVVREFIADDGVDTPAYQPRIGGWDHEMVYYGYTYASGVQPMIRWSAFSDTKRLATVPKRTFTFPIENAKAGVYRIMVVGCPDHYATVRLSPSLKTAVSGHPNWLHVRGNTLRRSYVYVPRGSEKLDVALCEVDRPRRRTVTLTAPDGTVLISPSTTTGGGFTSHTVAVEQFHDQILALDVSDGEPDYLLRVHFRAKRPAERVRNGIGHHAVLAPDAATAKAVQGGALYHDGQVFWHGFQIRFHEWIKTVAPDDFIIKDEQGKVLEASESKKQYGRGHKMEIYPDLPTRPGFVPLNAFFEPPPVSDHLMHSYSLHRNRTVLYRAILDLYHGLLLLGPGDYRRMKNFANLAYNFASYSYHYWRPAWRILQESDAPEEVKAIIHEAMILAGDRLSFAVGIERVNGNAFAHIPISLRYCVAATRDPKQEERFRLFFDRFRNEGWGEGVGISRSGDCQEHFAHDMHYGSYFLQTFQAIDADFADPEFKAIADRCRNLYSYIWCRRDARANPWSSRTQQSCREAVWTNDTYTWKGKPGADFTENVNGGNEWFAARRANYYAVTFHGRLAPHWMSSAFGGQLGFGGGMLCHLSVPGRGPVLFSQVNSSYGKGMVVDWWRDFQVHSMVGTLADERHFVAAVSEHDNATMVGNVVESSGEVRERNIRYYRRYTFEDDSILYEAGLAPSDHLPLSAMWSAEKRVSWLSQVNEAYELIPYGHLSGETTTITLLDDAGDAVGTFGPEPVAAVKTIVVDRGGYGCRIELDTPASVEKSKRHAMLVKLIDEPTPAHEVTVKYRIVPYQDAAQ